MRVVTRGDMDGLTGAVIVSLNERIDGIELIHPQDITAGKADIKSTDILINVPYHENCGMWFDHHQHTATYRTPPARFKGAYAQAPSAAGLVYKYYGGAEKMPEFVELVRQTDRMDSADLEPDDITDPKGYILLGFTIDARTGLGAFRNYFTILYELLRRNLDINKIIEHPVVSRRVQQMQDNEDSYRDALRAHSRLEGKVVVTDFRPLLKAPIGNRFLVYALYPGANVSVRLHWGPSRKTVIAALGHSIFNRGCRSNLGSVAARYGGGGHRGAASIPVTQDDDTEDTLSKIIGELRRAG